MSPTNPTACKLAGKHLRPMHMNGGMRGSGWACFECKAGFEKLNISTKDMELLTKQVELLDSKRREAMPKIKELEYQKRFNTAKYEHEQYTVAAALDEDENPLEGFEELKQLVAKAHAGEVEVAMDEDDAEDEEPAKTSKKKTSKKSSKKNQEDEDGEEDSDEDTDEQESGEDGEDSEEDETDADGEEGEDDGDSDDESDESERGSSAGKRGVKNDVAGKKSSKENGPGKKAFKKKGSDYDRAEELHKKLLGDELRTSVKGWPKDPQVKAKSLIVSKIMQGAPFLDSEGEMVPDFMKKFVSYMKKPATDLSKLAAKK